MANVINGLAVIYPNVRDIPSSRKMDHYKQVLEDNSVFVSKLVSDGYYTVWMPQYGIMSSHIEVWPLANSTSQHLVITVPFDGIRPEITDRFLDHLVYRFQTSHKILWKHLQKVGITIAARLTHDSQPRLILY